ncbi:MAG: ComEC/Rec2 family competence protein [Desulfosalsimonadaceae bacterium]
MTSDAPYDQRSAAAIKTAGRCYHRPVIPLLFSLIAGIIAGRHIPISWFPPAAFLLVFMAMGWLIFSVIRKRPLACAPILLFFILGWLAISSFVPPAFPPESVLPFMDGTPRKISGTVVQPPVHMGFRTRCVLTDMEVHTGGDSPQRKALPGNIQLTVYGDAPDILPGARITIFRPIRPVRNFANPGGFDYRQYMAYRNTWGTAWDSGKRIELAPHEKGKPFLPAVSNVRMAIDQGIASVNDEDTRAVLSALIIGKKDRISPGLRASFNRAGVSHLLAISGLHVGIVATVSFFLISVALSRSTFLLKRGIMKKTAALLSMLFVLAYGMIAGMSPSTQRAVIMICIFLAAYVFDRQYNRANTVAAAALGILAVSPQSLFDISFQLSFAAVAAILMGLYWMPVFPETVDEPFRKRLLRIVTGFMWVSILAIIGTTPLLAYYFNQATLLGIIANLLLIPLIGFIVVPLGLTSALLYFLFKPAGLFGFSIAERLLQLSLFIVNRIADLPYGSFTTVTPSILELVCIYILLISVPLLLIIRKKGRNGKPPYTSTGMHAQNEENPILSYRRTIAATAAIAVAVLTMDAAYWVHRRFFNSELTVTYLDVGQGNAAFIEIPGGETLLIDGGGFGDNASFDVGAMIVAPFLWRNKVRSIDTVILSHPHSDHLNGLLYILDNFDIGKVISTHYPADSANYSRFLERIQHRGIDHPAFSDIPDESIAEGADVHIFYPPRAQPGDQAPANLNNGSVVARLSFNGTSFLFPGDVESTAEAEIVKLAGERLRSTFMLSPHHGSSTSSSAKFLDAVDPEVIVVSARKDRFGFPSDDVLERYTQRGCIIYQTETHGAVKVIVTDDLVEVIPTTLKAGKTD